MIDGLLHNEEKYLPYAVDLDIKVQVASNYGDGAEVHEIVIKGGIGYENRYVLIEKTYKLRNIADDEQEKEVIVEQPITPNTELLGGNKSASSSGNSIDAAVYELESKTATHYRFKVKVPSVKKTTNEAGVEFKVTERKVHSSSFGLQYGSHYVQQIMLDYAQDDELVNAQLNTLLVLTAEIAEVAAKLKQANADVQQITANQARIRQNLKAVGNKKDDAALRSKWVQSMVSEEDELKLKTTLVETLTKEYTAKNATYNQILSETNFVWHKK